MNIPAEVITDNYRESLALALKLIAQSFRRRGYDSDSADSELIELAHSVLGTEPVVQLIQTKVFSYSEYSAAIVKAIEACKKEFFLDVQKKRFISIDASDFEIPCEESQNDDHFQDQIDSDTARKALLKLIAKKVSPLNLDFLKRLLDKKSPDLRSRINEIIIQRLNKIKYLPFETLDTTLTEIRKHYPDGSAMDTREIDGRNELSKEQIIEIYKNVYWGIDQRYPPFLLGRESGQRAKIITCYLIENILNANPQEILEEIDETFFMRNKIQNIFRFFNYSANRVLRNAYPEMIPPWLFSKIEDNFWENRENRLKAIHWLVEQRLKINIQELFKVGISRKDFARNGLSYLFNHYYKSVSKSLHAAYPHLQPWELGFVSRDYWTDEKAAMAIRWLVEKKRWSTDELPELVKQNILNRKTFSEFGLATLFEKKYGKSIFKALDCAFPGKFSPWEFGNVSLSYWQDQRNIFKAARWIANKEGLTEDQIPNAVRSRRLNFGILNKYSIGKALNRISRGILANLFAPLFWQEHRNHTEELRLLKKLQLMIRQEEQATDWSSYLLYGFFVFEVQSVSHDSINRYRRKIRRIKRRSPSPV